MPLIEITRGVVCGRKARRVGDLVELDPKEAAYIVSTGRGKVVPASVARRHAKRNERKSNVQHP